MKNEKVLLLELRERVSASGNTYLSGWLGKASVVGFMDREAAEPTWQVYVSTPSPKPGQKDAPRRSNRRSVEPGDLDDDLSDIGRTS